ncbi:MAG TPA: hypothetical protein VFO66_07475 [Gemmatimonadaceae bacterium]|nr:hypothetical protein [Gemmatimonadaceae bacterium]
MVRSPRIFLLSPARCDGRRAATLLNPAAEFPLAVQLRQREGAPLGEVFAFMSGLYFRGKLTYARAFATADATALIRIITTSRGLLEPEYRVRPADLREFAAVDLSAGWAAFQDPLLRDAKRLDRELGGEARAVLLGSIASDKYVGPLTSVFGDRLVFPIDFVGRGDMSRGGVMLRAAQSGEELRYEPVATAVRHGKRPPKLKPLRS